MEDLIIDRLCPDITIFNKTRINRNSQVLEEMVLGAVVVACNYQARAIVMLQMFHHCHHIIVIQVHIISPRRHLHIIIRVVEVVVVTPEMAVQAIRIASEGHNAVLRIMRKDIIQVGL